MIKDAKAKEIHMKISSPPIKFPDYYGIDTPSKEELIYTALDYEHPPILELDPPLTLQQGQSIISRATYNNTTNDYVNFGLLSTDEMMIIFGLVYFE